MPDSKIRNQRVAPLRIGSIPCDAARMELFHPLLYSVRDGAAQGVAVRAENPIEACRKAAADLLEMSLPEVDRAFARREIEVIAVIKGNPEFTIADPLPFFPGIRSDDQRIVL